jgi:hypothetical protein
MRIIRIPNGQRPPQGYDPARDGEWPRYSTFTGVRAGEEFVQGKAYVLDDAKAARLVADFGYIDVTDEERELSAAERARLTGLVELYAPELRKGGKLP